MMYFLLLTIIATVEAFPSYSGTKGCSFASKFPPIDGNRDSNQAYFNASFKTDFTNMYEDLPNPRFISNLLGKQVKKGNDKNISSTWIYMGQFIDHDITLTPTGDISMNIEIPHYDEIYNINDGWINFSRSIMFSLNTAYLDLSSVYGDTLERSRKLRSFKDGKLMSKDNFLPKNVDINIPMANNDSDSYACGDVRCNEHSILLGFHNLFHKEHNRLAKEYQSKYPYYSDEHLFQLARFHNILQYQKIVYEEWLPLITGSSNINWQNNLELYPDNFFSTVAFRFGHSAIPDKVLFKDQEENLFDHFFKPYKFNATNIADYMEGTTRLEQEEVDLQVVDSLRNHMFQNENQRLDLLSINIQRGRDHNLMAFHQYYKKHTNIDLTSFEQLTQNKTISDTLKDIYGSVDKLDPFVGLLSEDHAPNSIVGLLAQQSIKNQFERMAGADKYFYKKHPNFGYKTITQLFKIHYNIEKDNVFSTN